MKTHVHYSAPGKVFLLGEYSVLAEGEGLLAAVGPRFSLKIEQEQEAGKAEVGLPYFHPESPAGKLLDWAVSRGAKVPHVRFIDPWNGAGGFGASTAQFALLYTALAERNGWNPGWQSAWVLYREIASATQGPRPAFPASGADLAAQMVGGISRFRASNTRDDYLPDSTQVYGALEWGNVLVFSATGQLGRKVATHEHLSELSRKGSLSKDSALPARLANHVRRGLEAIENGNLAMLGAEFTDFARTLAESALELPATKADREALCAIEGVAGAKGMGALQADGLLVVIESEQAREQVIRVADERGLQLAANGLRPEEGIRCGG